MHPQFGRLPESLRGTCDIRSKMGEIALHSASGDRLENIGVIPEIGLDMSYIE